MQNLAASGVVFGFVGLSARPGTRDPGSARFRPLQYAFALFFSSASSSALPSPCRRPVVSISIIWLN